MLIKQNSNKSIYKLMYF